MSESRARMVLAWIDGIESRGDLDEHFEDIIADHRFAPGQILLIAPLPLLPLDLDLFARARQGSRR